jgi:hypothetical protein
VQQQQLREAIKTNGSNKRKSAATISVFGSKGALWSSITQNAGEMWSFWTAFWTIFGEM